jgi:hypothetical protein
MNTQLKAASLVLVSLSLASLLNSQAATPADPGPRTTVVNTISNPVPVQLTGTVLNSTNPLPVEIKNTNVIQVVHGPSQPFQTNVLFDTGTIGRGGAGFNVPAGKLLVIECVSIIGPGGLKTPFVNIQTKPTAGAPATAFNLLMNLQGDTWLSGSQLIRAYGGPAQDVFCFAAVDSPTPATFLFNLSGYFLDVQ